MENLRSLYLSSTQKDSGTIAVSLGLLQFLKTHFHRVAVFKPIIKDNIDMELLFLKEYFSLDIKDEYLFGCTLDEIERLISLQKEDDFLTKIINLYSNLKQDYDFILILGLSKEYIVSLENDINYTIAKNLSTPFINVINGYNKSIEHIIEDITIEHKVINNEGLDHFATFVNKIKKRDIKLFYKKIKRIKISNNIYPLPYIKKLQTLTMNDLYTQLNIKLLYGQKKFLNQQISQIKVISMLLENCLDHIEDNDLIILSGDRIDILSGVLFLLTSSNPKRIAGIVLSGGLQPKGIFDNILKTFSNLPIAILGTKDDTYTTIVKIKELQPKLTKKSYTKISLLLGAFTKYVNPLFNLECKSNNDLITPLMFEYKIFNLAKQEKKHIVLPESYDDRILRATEILLNRRIVEITLLGDRQNILNRAKILGINISKANIVDPLNSSLTQEFAQKFYELRKEKGIYLKAAMDIMKNDINYFATMMVKEGYVDGMVSGASSTTANTVRPALQIIKTKPNIDIVSSVFFICLDTKVLVFADCAINPNPTAQQLSQIALSSIETAQSFGVTPKVAMLSYSTGSSGSGVDVDKVIKATTLVKEQNSLVDIDGPLQYDAAIDKTVAQKKLPNSNVAGSATILIFPDLNSGNNTYKAVQRSSNAVAIGPILQGLNKPINDLSRGCSVKDIINTVAITAIQ